MGSEQSKTIYGLIGYPLTHSFSCDFFNKKFAAEGINAEYLNFEIDDVERLCDLVGELPELRGLNVTAPYKEAVLPLLNALDDDARTIGAVNVIKVFHDKHSGKAAMKGYNSDSPAFSRTIEPLLTPRLDRALVLGTGGAAKAVSHALQGLGVTVQLVSRRKSAATVTYEEITRSLVARHKLVINATPLGKWPDVDQCPDFPFRFLTSEHLCYDLIYNPDETCFLRRSLEMGAQVKNGLEKLLLQAFISYQMWTE